MSDFKTISSVSFSRIEDQLIQAKEKYEKSVTLFGEDKQKCTPEEFFGTFNEFLTSFSEVKIDNENFRKKKEEEEKRARLEAEVRFNYCLFIYHKQLFSKDIFNVFHYNLIHN